MMNTNLAIVFPGQGSQTVGMLSDIAAQFPEVKNIFTQASDALHFDLWQLVQFGPASDLDQTSNTQPALLAASYALWQILEKRMDLQSVMLAGHSLGEYTALVCAQSLQFSDAIKLVAARGLYMQEAVPDGEGAMAAIIGLTDNEVIEICQQISAETTEVLAPANFNSIGQVVVAGNKAAVDKAMMVAKERGARMAVAIPVSVPSHCELMHPAAEKLAELLKTMTIQAPNKIVINNVDVEAYTTPEMIRAGLVKQLYKPVRWVETIQYFIAQGKTTILECGPGKILTGLNKRINKNLNLITSDATFLGSM